MFTKILAFLSRWIRVLGLGQDILNEALSAAGLSLKPRVSGPPRLGSPGRSLVFSSGPSAKGRGLCLDISPEVAFSSTKFLSWLWILQENVHQAALSFSNHKRSVLSSLVLEAQGGGPQTTQWDALSSLVRHQEQLWACWEDPADAQQRHPFFLQVSVQNKALLFSPSSAKGTREDSQSRNQLSNVLSLLGTTFKCLGFSFEVLGGVPSPVGRGSRAAVRAGAVTVVPAAAPPAPETSDCACMFCSRLPEPGWLLSQRVCTALLALSILGTEAAENNSGWGSSGACLPPTQTIHF